MVETDIGQLKREQRALALARRRAMSGDARAQASALICAALEALPRLGRARTVLSYLPMWDEADVSAANAFFAASGALLAYPVTVGAGRMEAYAAPDAAALLLDRLGFYYPDPAVSAHIAPEAIDAVIVPCVAFDGERRRLGHGAGYYDRFLLRCPRALTVAAAFETQRMERVVCGEHDLPVALVVSDRAVY